eukprot:COSAG02_NODE_66559_length_255_cov_0.660256_1_plen_62_part_10
MSIRRDAVVAVAIRVDRDCVGLTAVDGNWRTSCIITTCDSHATHLYLRNSSGHQSFPGGPRP